LEAPDADADEPRPATIGDYDVQVLTDVGSDGQPRPVAVLAAPTVALSAMNSDPPSLRCRVEETT
jgi:hypothetical protein